MSLLDIVEYEIPEDGKFSNEWLLQITDIVVYWWFCKKAYGTPEPGANDKTIFCRSTTLKFHKKAISNYMPQKHQTWDEIRKEGNPTKTHPMTDIIKQVEKHKVRGMGL